MATGAKELSTVGSIPERIREAVTSSNWDAVVVLGVENAHYWSGAFYPYARSYLDRPSIVIWPREGEPIYIIGADWIDVIKASSFITRFVGYSEGGALPPAVIVDTVADVLRSESLAEGLIGLEMLRTSALFYDRLLELLPEAKFESADDVLRRLRMVKTTAELETMCTIARWTEDGIWKAFRSSKAGEREHDLGVKVHLNVLENGCTFVSYMLLGVREGARSFFPPTERRLEVGDMVRLDINTLYGGYYCDMGRMAVVGEPNPEQTKAYQDHVELKRRIIEFMQPGRTCSEVHAFYVEQVDRMNIEAFTYEHIGIGHGVGVNADEYPKLNATDQTILEPGMILALEPDTIGPEGELMHVEDMLLVTTEGVEVLTQSEGHDWSELPVIPA